MLQTFRCRENSDTKIYLKNKYTTEIIFNIVSLVSQSRITRNGSSIPGIELITAVKVVEVTEQTHPYSLAAAPCKFFRF